MQRTTNTSVYEGEEGTLHDRANSDMHRDTRADQLDVQPTETPGNGDTHRRRNGNTLEDTEDKRFGEPV